MLIEISFLTSGSNKLIVKTLQLVNRFLEYDPGYVSPAKEALNMLGLPAGIVRRPMPELTLDQKEQLRQALREIGLLLKLMHFIYNG